MKHGELQAIAHNLADSMGSGIGLLIGIYTMDIYGEAASSEEGFITVDFLNKEISGGSPSDSLRRAIDLYIEELPAFCERNNASIRDFQELQIRFWKLNLHPFFLVTVKDKLGARSSTEYSGIPGKRTKVLDELGRVRKKT